jgi:glutathione reductase (NADPH)
MSVAMIESHDLGGTCPNRGCTPKKVLVAAGHALHEIERAATHCISVGKPKLDWAALIDREKELIKGIPERLTASMIKRGVTIIKERGMFAGPNLIKAGDRLLKAKHIVIATGSRPRDLPIPGADLMITSDDMLNERTLPGSIVFIGGGVISLEFGHVFARAGTKVTILEAFPQLLPAMDADAVAKIQKESARIGIDIKLSVKVERIEQAGNGFRVSFTHDGIAQTITAERVVNGAGRVANVDTLDLAAANVNHTDWRITTDPYLRSTSNPSVYVCGDAVPTSPQLSPIATYEGELIGRNIVDGARHTPDYDGNATAVYTVPALAAVGFKEKAARDKGLKIKVHTTDMLEWLSARTYAETLAWAKIIVDEDSDMILGAHMVGHSAEELVNLFAMAMTHGIPARAIKDKIYAYPTFTSDIKHLI